MYFFCSYLMLFLAPSFSFRASYHFPLFISPLFIYLFSFLISFILYSFPPSVLLFCQLLSISYSSVFFFLVATFPFRCSCRFPFILPPALLSLDFLLEGYILCIYYLPPILSSFIYPFFIFFLLVCSMLLSSSFSFAVYCILLFTIQFFPSLLMVIMHGTASVSRSAVPCVSTDHRSRGVYTYSVGPGSNLCLATGYPD
jgi:hypothetical protein